MSRFGMGYGKDDDTHLLKSRPAVRVHSSRCQLVLNKWFQGDSEERPDILRNKYEKKPKQLPDDQGEWQLVWHPRDRIDSPTMPSRKVLTTLKDEEEKDKLKEKLARELMRAKGRGTDSRQQVKEDLEAAGDRKGSRGSKRLGSGRGASDELPPITSRSNMSQRVKSGMSTARDGQEMALETQRSNASQASRASRASRRSKSSMSASSTVTRNKDELLSRIKGLEDALLNEKELRERMQSLLKLETWANETSED